MKFRLALLGFALAGCAQGAGAGGLPPGAREIAASVFLSPSGEPFRPASNGRPPLEQWFSRADADGSGEIDRAEFRADAERFFRTADASGDGVIDDVEVQAYERSIAPEIAPDFAPRAGSDAAASEPGPDDIIRLPPTRSDRAGRGRNGERGAGGPLRLLQEPQAILGADADQSRSVTREEFLQATEGRFSALDSARDGRLARTDLRLLRPFEGRTRMRRGEDE